MDLTESPLFELVLAAEFVIMYILCFALIPTDLLFYDIGSVILENLENVKNHFSHAIESKNPKDLKKAIEIHSKTIDCFKSLQSIYAPILLNKFMWIAVLICVLGFQITLV